MFPAKAAVSLQLDGWFFCFSSPSRKQVLEVFCCMKAMNIKNQGPVQAQWLVLFFCCCCLHTARINLHILVLYHTASNSNSSPNPSPSLA